MSTFTTLNFETDPGKPRGLWLCNEEAIQIKVGKKSNTNAALADLTQEGAEMLIYSNSNFCVNEQNQLGGRFTFTIPRSMFMRVLPVPEAQVKVNTGNGYKVISTQRAPGKCIRIKLSSRLSKSQKLDAITKLESSPILIKLFSKGPDELNRMSFVVFASDEWDIS